LPQSHTRRLFHRLQPYADSATKRWWENYVKASAPFLGVKMPVIRRELHHWHKEFIQGSIELEDQVHLAIELIEQPYTEEKLAGILYFQEILLPARAIRIPEHLVHFARLFDQGMIYDWNVCDWFCVKVLGPLIQREGTSCAPLISDWSRAENLWRARASLVAFVKVARDSLYYPEIRRSCCTVIQRPERFAKTAVGWILREISNFDKGFVQKVVEENLPFFTLESLNNAMKYFDPDVKLKYRHTFKSNNDASLD
jgi:3-methyladenine DNA glycosylase AlkD